MRKIVRNILPLTYLKQIRKQRIKKLNELGIIYIKIKNSLILSNKIINSSIYNINKFL